MTESGSEAPVNFIFVQCRSAGCGLRFPVAASEGLSVCPRCGTPLDVVATVSHGAREQTLQRARRLLPRRVEVVVDNLRSIYNVGSVFRTADGVGLHHLYLCGITPTPAHPKLRKTALGAEEAVAWSYHANAPALVDAKRGQGMAVWALEADPDATPLEMRTVAALAANAAGLLLVIGNENAGVDPALLARADRVLRLPMRGVKRSLNVATAFSAAVYLIAEALTAAAESHHEKT